MDCSSGPGVIAGSKEPRSRRADVASPPRTAPPRPDGRASLSPDPASPAARDPRGCSSPFPRRASLRRRLRPRENAATLLRGARVAALVLAAAALALGVAENAAAQTTLVSNVVETSGVAHISFNQEAAQAFTTGATGATVSSVEIISSDTQGDDFDLSLCATSANDRPTSTCTELTAPSSFAAGTLVFTAPANTTLDPTTTYAVLMTPESASVTVPGLGSNDEDTGGAMGWTIADTHQFTNAADDWRTSTPGGGRSLRIAIKGTLTASANTAPTAAHNTVTTGEDRAYAFMAGDFGFDDTDTGDTLASVKIVTVPLLGTLALDGTAVMADGVVTTAQIDADMLTFRPAQDAHGDPYTTFTFKVNDGTVDSASAYTMTIDVTDAPLPVCGVPDITGAGRRQIWTGTVTVERFEFSGFFSYGFAEGLGGTLLPSQSFFIGSSSYVIDSLAVPPSGNLHFSLEGFSALTSKEVGALRLHVCDGDYDFITSSESENTTSWLATTLDWSPPVVTRTVYLSLPANNVATGEPAITGTAQAGQDLTATAGTIMDTDGVPSSFTYQWVRVDADGMSNPADITDATAATYSLTAADAGKKIKVQVSFTDELSGVEMRTSAAYPSSGTVTAASTTAPALTSVTVTSTPHKTTDTYGAREHIEFSMTFDAPVTVTGDPTFAFDLGGASTASYYAGSGTATLRFSHAVTGGTSGDRDTNGISWAENAIVLNGGTIAGRDNAVVAVLTHAAQSNLAGHKVDGRTTAVTPATVTDVVVTSTPMLMASGSSTADTYGFGETIVITVTVSEAVEVEGDPGFRFNIGNPGSTGNVVEATYDRTRSIATTIVFTYTVQAADMDTNGFWIGPHSQTFLLDANDRIRTASQQINIDRTHTEEGTQDGHKVDGSLGAPTVPPDPTAPTLVLATATTLTIEWTHPGDGGSPLTRNFIEYRVEGTTDWTNWYRGETPTQVTRAVITNLAAATAYDVRVHATNAIGNSQWVQSATAFSTLAGTASCAVPTFTGRRKIWTGVLTMGDFTEFPHSLRGYDSTPESGDGGGLDPATFTLGLRDYDVGRFALVTSDANNLNFYAGQGQGEWWDSTVLALRLHVCNTNFDFSDSGYMYADEDRIVIESNHRWTTDLDWSGVTTRTGHLSLPLNRPATGAPVITGPATVGQVLAVDVTGIEDEDGLHDVEYTYQWVRVDADGTSNEEDITDETDATYTLTDDDLGKKVKIEVSFPDDFGSDEQRTSAPTDTVTAVAMTTPGVTVSTTALTVTEEDTTGDSYTVVLNTQPTANVTVTVAGHAGTDVTPSPTSLTFTTTTWGTAQTVTVTAGDDADTANDAVSLTHSAASTDTGYEGISIDGVAVTVNDNDTAPATGAPTITGTAQVGQTLTAVTTGIMDADGLTSPTYTYQWIRVDGTDEADIASANSSTYILGDADLGTTLKVRVTFADDLGHTETLTSAATATVGAVATGPPTVTEVAVTSTPASGTTYYLADEVIEFTVTFSAPVTVTATPKFAFRLGAATRQAAYASGSDSVALVFARTVQAGEVDRNGISWNAIALALDGGTITQTGATTAASLTHAEQANLEGHRVDAAPPMQVSASVHGMSLVLVYDEPLDPASMPATGAYTVTATVGATTTNPAVSEVSIYGIWVTLALDAAPAVGATVTLAYAPPASNPVQDEAGNDAPAFSGQSVRLGPPPPDLAQVMGVTVAPGNAQLVVTWTAVDNATGYTVQWKSGGQGYNTGDRQATVTSGTTTSHTITGLANGTEYTVQVSATRTGANDGPPSDEMTGTPTVPTAAGIAVSTAALTVTEQDSTGDGYTVVLDTEPTADVVVTVAGHVGTDVTANPTALTFTMSNWETAQTVTVTADDDADTTDDSVALTHSAASADSGYSGIAIAGVAVTVNDNDTAQVLGVGVAPGNAQLVVTWTAVDNATGYTVQWTSGGQGYNTGDRQATVTSGSTTSHTITGLANGTEYTVQVSATRTGANDGPPSDEMTGTPTVPTAAGIAVSTAALTVTEQDSTGDGYTVVLDTEPTADVVVTVAGHVGTDVTANPTALTFTMSNWETAQTVTVTADDDADTTDDSVALTHSAASADSGYSGIAIAGVAVTVNDNDTAQVLGVGVAPGNAQLVVTWTAVDNATGYTVQWTSGSQAYNTGDRQATVTSGSTTSHTITGLANGTEYTVQVSATRTGANDGPPSDEMTGTPFTTPPPPPPDLAQVMGVGVVPGNAQLVVTWTAVDNATGYTVQWTSGSQAYNTGDRQATVTSGSTTSHTITGLANGTEYTVQVSATRTGANDGPPSDEMTGTPFTTPPPPPPVTDLAQVMGVGVAPGNAQLVVTWTAVSTATGYTVQWKSSGQGYNTGDRQATVTSGTTTSHTITGLANGTEYTVQVSATRTGANDGPPSDEMTGTPTVPTAAGIAVSTAALTVTEQDSTGDGYTVVLDTEPTADVVVTVAGHVGTDVTANPTALTFTMSNWETAQTVTVTADDDADTTDDSVALTHSAASADSGYSGIAIAGVAVTVNDNDTAQVMGVGVVPGNAQLVVTWTAVDNATGYTVQWTSGGQGYNTGDRQATVTSGSTTSHTITGLANGTAYTVRVIATRTGANDGPPSSAVTASPVTTPGAPQHLSAVPGYAQVTLTWDAPSSDGGSAILRYEVAVDDSGTWIDAGLDLEETVTGLTNGQRYTFAVRAVNAAGTGPAATVTIVTSHPLPQAWLARFGRAATDHVVDAVSSRWQGGPQASHLTIGGVQTGALFGWIGRVGQAARDTADDRGDPVRTETSWTRLFAPSGGAGTGGGGTGPGMTVTDRNTGPVGLGGVDRKAGATLSGRAAQGALLGALGLPDPRALTDLRAALLGSSFFYSGAGDEDGQPRTPGRFGEWSAWGRGAASWFSGTDSGLSLDGEVVTAMLGLDSRWERWLAGVVVSHSRGQGTYAHPTATGGAVASSLTALHPYAGYKFNERTSIWGVLGYGVGEMSLTPERSVTALETGLMNAMAAVGGRMALSVRSGPAKRFELAIRSDARLTNTAADGVGAMAGAAGQTHRVRMMLEGSGVMPLASGGVLKPRLEAGLRYDAGDAETGAGLEAGGGLGYAFGRLSLEVNARGLLAHRDTQYEEWGFSGAVDYTPSEDGRGVSLRLGSGWGATQSGVQSLWRRQDASDLVRHAEFDAAQRYQVELRYGLDGLKGRVRWTPYIGVESGGGSSQALRLGVTLTSGRRFDAGLELGRRQGGPGAGPEHAGQIRVTLLW